MFWGFFFGRSKLECGQKCIYASGSSSQENLNIREQQGVCADTAPAGNIGCSAGSRCWSICCVCVIATYAGMPLINGPQGNHNINRGLKKREKAIKAAEQCVGNSFYALNGAGGGWYNVKKMSAGCHFN